MLPLIGWCIRVSALSSLNPALKMYSHPQQLGPLFVNDQRQIRLVSSYSGISRSEIAAAVCGYLFVLQDGALVVC